MPVLLQKSRYGALGHSSDWLPNNNAKINSHDDRETLGLRKTKKIEGK
jgi:hypothetical protein